MRTVLCGGMIRSGSTWQFNLVRLLLEESPCSSWSGWRDYIEDSNQVDLRIVKTHHIEDVERLHADTILTCHRDIRDVAGSLVRMGWCRPDWEEMRPVLDGYFAACDLWQPVAHHQFVFEEMMHDPLAEVRQTGLALNKAVADVEASALLERVNALVPKSDRPAGNFGSYDLVTQLHDGHVGQMHRQARSYLPDVLIALINDQYGDRLRAQGYSIESS